MNHIICTSPDCFSSNLNSPGTIFIRTPKSRKIRALWAKSLGLDDPKFLGKYICKDHINVSIVLM